MDLLSADVSLPYEEAKFLGIGGVHHVDFAIGIHQGLDVVNGVDQLTLYS